MGELIVVVFVGGKAKCIVFTPINEWNASVIANADHAA
jgi:hypothetical protein